MNKEELGKAMAANMFKTLMRPSSLSQITMVSKVIHNGQIGNLNRKKQRQAKRAARLRMMNRRAEAAK